MRAAVIAALSACLSLVFVGVGPVWAHANLVRAEPGPGAVVDDAHEVKIWFSEPPEPKFSEIAVLNTLGRPVAVGKLELDAREPLALLVDLPELEEGSYTVSWKALSAVDGHVTRGAFAFAIGIGQQPGQPTVAGLSPAEAAASGGGLVESVVRWWAYLAVAVLTGGVVFIWGVAGPALGWNGVQERSFRQPLIWTAGAALAAGLAGLILQAATVADVGLAEALGSPIWALLQTRYGQFWVARMTAILVLAASLCLVCNRSRRRWLAPLQLAIAAVLLLTIGLNSHAAAVPVDAAIAVALDWVHLVGTAIWIGGLFQLAVVTPGVLRERAADRGRVLGQLVGRFSPWAAWSVAVLVISGLYQAVIDLGSLEALIDTPWGRSLVAKLALVAAMLVFGLINTRWMRPRLVALATGDGSREGSPLARRFSRTVGAELIVGILVLGAVGVLTTQETGRDAVLRAPPGFRAAQSVDDLQIQLAVKPALAGANTVEVSLRQGWWGAPAQAQRVSLRFEHLEHDMGENEVVADELEPGRWGAFASGMAMVGPWQVSVLVRRDGRDDTRADFEVPLADPGAQTQQAGSDLLWRVSRALAGASLLAVSIVVLARSRASARPLVGRLAAAAAMLSAAVLFWAAVTLETGTPTVALSNPIPPTEASLDRGRELFAANCTACHGPSGRGDGPLAASLKPPPANLRQHAREHPETYLYGRIGRGSPGTAMPAFGGVLSEEDRWNVVNYIVQTLGADEEAGSPERSP